MPNKGSVAFLSQSGALQSSRPCMAHHRLGGTGPSLLVGVGPDIGPQAVDLVGAELAVPRRHRVLAVQHRVDEARMLVGLEPAQVANLPAARLNAKAFAGEVIERIKASATVRRQQQEEEEVA